MNQLAAPLISVVMPVYNVERYVGSAIESILDQTCGDFEFIIVCDAPTDASLDVVRGYVDPRIKVVEHPHNRGISAALNTGLEHASGRFVARMDSDDLSMPARFEKQLEVLQSDPGIAMCGTLAKLIDENDREVGEFNAPLGAAMAAFYWRPSPILHPSAMFPNPRGAWRYSEIYRWAQDYSIFLLLGKSGRLHNLPESLVRYRRHSSAAGVHRQTEQEDECHAIFQERSGFALPRAAYGALLKWNYTVPAGERHRWMRRVAAEFCGRYGYLHLLDDLRYARRRLGRRRSGRRGKA